MISIVKKTLAWNNASGDAVILRYTGITYATLSEYIVEHPLPDDPVYDGRNLMADLNSDSAWTLPDTISKEMITWLEDMINELL